MWSKSVKFMAIFVTAEKVTFSANIFFNDSLIKRIFLLVFYSQQPQENAISINFVAEKKNFAIKICQNRSKLGNFTVSRRLPTFAALFP